MIRIDWEKAGLGTMPDGKLAKKLGCHANTIKLQREKRGIPAHGRRPEQERNWGLLRLGERTDASIAAELGCSPSTVAYHRRRHGMDPANPRQEWDMDALGDQAFPIVYRGGTISEVAKSLGITQYRARMVVDAVGRPDLDAELSGAIHKYYEETKDQEIIPDREPRTWGEKAKQDAKRKTLGYGGASDINAAAYATSILGRPITRHMVRRVRTAMGLEGTPEQRVEDKDRRAYIDRIMRENAKRAQKPSDDMTDEDVFAELDRRAAARAAAMAPMLEPPKQS